MKVLYIEISDETHEKFKNLCKNSGVYMTEIVRDFITKLLENKTE